MEQKKYIEYTSTDFAIDDEFVRWVKHPNLESNIFWNQWVTDNPSKALEVSQAIELLKTVEFKEYEPSADKTLDVWRKIDNQITISDHRKLKSANHLFQYFKIAAMVILVSGISFFIIDSNKPSVPVTEELFVVKETANGVKSTIRLSDGTIVKLNSGSKLFYSNRFNETARTVELEGEAYFQVTHNAKKPFIVKTGTIQTKVLGTSFNVRAYSGENLQFVALEEGKIQIKGINDREMAYEEILDPLEMLVYNKTNRSHSVDEFDLSDIMAWKNNAIVFKNASFPEIQKELERWFGVTIYADKEISTEFGFTGKFYNETLTNILDNISIAMGFRYKIQNKQVDIYKK